MALAPFTIQPALIAAAGLFTNKALIADEVLPRVEPVSTQAFKYLQHNMADGFTIPDTRVGRASRPPQQQFSATEVSGQTLDYGLDVPVPKADELNAAGQLDPTARAATNPDTKATLLSKNIVMLDREVRVANLVFSLNTYLSTQRVTLSGTGQWSDYTNSNPRDAILSALDLMVPQRANVIVLGQLAWTKLRQHPAIVSAVLGNAGQSGAVTREQVAALLEVDRIVVGQGFLNTARPGQPVSMSRVWGKHCAMLYLDPMAGPFDMPSFGYTVPWGEPVAGEIMDPNMGIRGGRFIRYGESVAEVIATQACGYFFQNCVA